MKHLNYTHTSYSKEPQKVMVIGNSTIVAGPISAAPPSADMVVDLSGLGKAKQPVVTNIPALELRRDYVSVDWPDYGVPPLPRDWWHALVNYIKSRDGGTVYVGCTGGIGRTGTALAIMAHIALGVEEPIAWVRAHYLDHAVESAAQIEYVALITGTNEDVEPGGYAGVWGGYQTGNAGFNTGHKGGVVITETTRTIRANVERILDVKNNPFFKVSYDDNAVVIEALGSSVSITAFANSGVAYFDLLIGDTYVEVARSHNGAKPLIDNYLITWRDAILHIAKTLEQHKIDVGCWEKMYRNDTFIDIGVLQGGIEVAIAELQRYPLDDESLEHAKERCAKKLDTDTGA